jgi:hypothetical protein
MVAAETAPSATEALQEQPVQDTSIRETLLPYIPTFEQRVLIVAVLLMVLLAGNIWSLLRSRKLSLHPKQGHHPAPDPRGLNVLYKDPEHQGFLGGGTSDTKQGLLSKIPFRNLYLFNIVLAAIMVSIISATVLMRPYVIRTTPLQKEYLSDAAQEITFEFDIPVRPEEMELHISPETEGTWSFRESESVIPVTRSVTFTPNESFYPGSEVVVYAVGIRSFSGFGGTHEHALEFKAPKVPALVSVSPQNDSVNVSPDIEVVISFDAPVGNFVESKIEVSPSIETALTTNNSTQTISFPEGLEQDTEYTVSLFHTPRSYDIETGKSIVTGETKLVTETRFTTVPTPLVSSYSPKGTNVLPDTTIEVTFDQDMNRKSAESHFSIIPHVDGTISWKDDKTFMFTPEGPLPKETDFTFKFTAGMVSMLSGTIHEDITLQFTTIGAVTVSETFPVGGTYGHEPSTTNVSVTFDQEVDHTSAQEHFSISPAVSGSFSWNGNSLTYATAGKLGYSTKYTVQVSSGVESIHGLPSRSAFSFSFTTRDHVFSLNVPWYKQQENFTCNVAAIRMVLAYRGVYLSEAQIKSMLGIGTDPNSNWVPGYGVHWGPASNLIGNYRSVSVKQGWTLEEILREVEQGNPVILWWYNRYSQPPGAYTLESGVTGWMGMHSEVVRGYIGSPSNPTAILTNDPWRGQLTYSPSLFMSTWGYIGYAALVVR